MVVRGTFKMMQNCSDHDTSINYANELSSPTFFQSRCEPIPVLELSIIRNYLQQKPVLELSKNADMNSVLGNMKLVQWH